MGTMLEYIYEQADFSFFLSFFLSFFDEFRWVILSILSTLVFFLQLYFPLFL